MRAGEQYTYLYDGRRARVNRVSDDLVFLTFEDDKTAYFHLSTFHKYFRRTKESILLFLSPAVMALCATLIVRQIVGSSEWVLVILFLVSWVALYFGMERVGGSRA